MPIGTESTERVWGESSIKSTDLVGCQNDVFCKEVVASSTQESFVVSPCSFSMSHNSSKDKNSTSTNRNSVLRD